MAAAGKAEAVGAATAEGAQASVPVDRPSQSQDPQVADHLLRLRMAAEVAKQLPSPLVSRLLVAQWEAGLEIKCTEASEYSVPHVPWYCSLISLCCRGYGSGYPGVASRGVGGLGFPFVFWPVIWGGGLGYGGAYLYNHEVRILRRFLPVSVKFNFGALIVRRLA